MDSNQTKRIEYHSAERLSTQIEKAKNELEEMIDLNPQVVVLLDKHGRVVRANRATLEFFNIVDFSAILYKDINQILRCSDPELVTSLLGQSEGYRSVEVESQFKDKGKLTLKLTLVSSGKSHDSSILIINDISAESRKARNLEKQHKREAVQALTGALMHNINQPLTVLMMRAQMVKLAIQHNRIDPSEVRRGIDDVMKLTMTVADMLQAVDRPHDFVTEPYVEGVDILDLKKSTNADASLDLTCSAMLDILLVTLDNRIPGTILHARKCGALAGAISERAGLPSRDCEVARQVGYIHDIGKLAIPDSITLKPSSLTPDEQTTMRTHAETGYKIVRGLIFLQDEAEAVRTHHEFWDGSGYPGGLSGEDIPVAARVVAAADAFEVMLSGRPYRGAVPLETAVHELKTNRGSQFDPALADVVVENAAELHELLESVSQDKPED